MSFLEVKEISKSFGNLKVLKNVNLSVKEGEKIVIIGGSGCGKSVFLRLLERLEEPDGGQIYIDGEEITAKNADVDRIRLKMGMVFQNFRLFSHLSVMENLCLAPVKVLGMQKNEAESKALDLLRQVGLVQKANDYPAVLSGGQQQRIAICRSLMMDPKVILFDEPTSALDPTMVGEVLAVMRMLAKRSLTMIIVTHEMNFAREIADRILYFDEGGIYEEGTPAEIFDAPKKEKTIAFIRKFKYFSFDITQREFDLMELQGGIQIFGEKYGMDHTHVYRLQICAEELIYEMLHSVPEDAEVRMHLDIRYSDSAKKTQFYLSSAGEKYNPFEQDEDGLGITILKSVAENLKYSHSDGKNQMEGQL